MKSFSLALVLVCAASGLAHAGPCDDDLKTVEAAIRTADLPADQKAQLREMRQQAADLCAAGNEAEGADVLSEAKAMLAVEE